MNNTPDSRELAAAIEQTKAALLQAQDELDAYNRMKAAAMRVKQLQDDLAAVTRQYDETLEAERQADFDARMAAITDIQVSAEGSDIAALLHGDIDFTVTRLSYSSDYHQNIEVVRKVRGFDALPHDEREWLVHRKPDRIPLSIRSLAPDDADAAIAAFLRIKRRGYATADDMGIAAGVVNGAAL